jgi:hypothetical protein
MWGLIARKKHTVFGAAWWVQQSKEAVLNDSIGSGQTIAGAFDQTKSRPVQPPG